MLSILRRCALPLTLFGAAFLSPLGAKEFFVAPNGSDTAAGTKAAPFATVQRAQQAVEAGDTVFIRGGTYRMTGAQIGGRAGAYDCITLLEKSGAPGKPIRYWAYRGERPVFDCSDVKPAGRRVTAFRVNGSWLHLKGIEVVGVQVTITGHSQSICFDNEGSNNVYEQLSMHDGMAIGLWIGDGANNLVLNCDAYRNHDPVSSGGRGGNVDGFGYHGPKGSVNNVFRGCRAWFNSDDGFDFIHSGEVARIEACWAFYNGFSTAFAPLADGNGFKAAGWANRRPDQLPDPLPRHVVTGSVAVRNKANGFYANHHPGGIEFTGNTAYKNPVNFNLLGRDPKDNVTKIPGRGHRLKNNLGFAATGSEVAELDSAASDVSGNYFNLAVTITAEDFLGLDEADLVKPRKRNGDLPDVAFLHLARGSDAIDRGVDVGRPFKGRAPDLGAFESKRRGIFGSLSSFFGARSK
ncbi:MAG TPA: DUF4990 domain-containing protein [Opitutaceae bacterium]|nr:DUF4990 domain-containing protein [Opitutaceae bacterium]